MRQVKAYVAAKLEHAGKIVAARPDGFHINARWIDTAEIGRQRLKPVTHWAQENYDDIDAADVFILYVEPGDHLKGALVETGYAIKAGKRVWIAGDGHGTDALAEDGQKIRLPHKDIAPWCWYRQSVRIFLSLDEAFKDIRRLVRMEPYEAVGRGQEQP